MEQVDLQNQSTVCENNLATELENQISNNVSGTNLLKSACRTKNGLINGIIEENCNTSKNLAKIALISNQDLGKSISDDHNITQNYIPNTALSQQYVEQSLNYKLDLSETSQGGCYCSDPSSSSSAKHGPNKSNSVENCVGVDNNIEKADLDSHSCSNTTNAVNKFLTSNEDQSTELTSNSSSSVHCTADVLECQQDSIDLNKLRIENTQPASTSQCEKIVVSEVVDSLDTTTKAIGDSVEICYAQYESELQMPLIMKIIQKDLSEPYSIYTYRYFIHNWPKLCFLAMCGEICVGAIVCKLDYHRKSTKRGYIAMLAVDQHYRKRQIGSTLVHRAIKEMIAGNADEVVLETEVTNKPALRLYELLGFVRDKRLFRYYLNGVDALRLKLWLR